MKKWMIILTALAMVGLGSGFTFAKGHGKHHGNMQDHEYRHGKCENVDPVAHAAFMKETAELRVALMTDRAEMAALMAQETPDAKAVVALAERIGKNRAMIALKAKAHGIPHHKMGMGGHGMGHGGMKKGGGCM